MEEEKRGHTPDNLVWTGKDHRGATVNLYVPERDHIIYGHGEIMGNNFTAIYDSVTNPDSVYNSGSYDNREVFFKKSGNATYYPHLITKTIVEYTERREKGFIVTAMPVKKEGGNVGEQTYPENDIRQE